MFDSYRAPIFRLFPLIIFVITINAHGSTEDLCTPGHRVFVEPGNHPATVLAVSSASCRVHYEDNAYIDGWAYKYNLKAADADARNAAAAAKGPALGRYTITVGTSNLFDGYLILSSTRDYEYILPGGKSAGKGQYSFDPAGTRIH